MYAKNTGEEHNELDFLMFYDKVILKLKSKICQLF